MKAKARAAPVATPDEAVPFWRRKTLSQMSRTEWESLCDGCGKCCLHKLEDTDTGALAYTNVACRLLDLGTCRCTDYAHRHVRVPDCIRLSAGNLDELRWLPMTCSYRLVAEKRELYWWHHLVSGDRNTVHQAGMSVRATAIGEDDAGALEDHVVAWEEVPAPPKRARSKR